MPLYNLYGLKKIIKALLQRNQTPLTKTTHHKNSEHLKRTVTIDLYLPPNYNKKRSYPLLLLNDGQDLLQMKMEEILTQLYQQNILKPHITIGIHADKNRMQEYGTAHQPDYKNRGSKAATYTQFIMEELLQWLQEETHPKHFTQIAIAGFSLGGLSALDIVWKNPSIFTKVGVFSGALWWRSQPFDEANPDADRIIHTNIENGTHHPNLKFWLQTGTNDETDDRNKNGIIDSIDDTNDLIKALQKQGYRQPQDIQYTEVQDGEHNPQTWAKVMPQFLQWCYPASK